MKNLILKSVVAACAVAACAVVAVRAVAFAAPRESVAEIAAENADCAAPIEVEAEAVEPMPLDEEGWRCEGDCDEHADCEFCNPPED